MNPDEIARALEALGCPAEKSADMARMLIKRAGQRAREQSISEEEALVQLLQLMRQGWAARERGL
jgi:cbb3-type cytochrome oxidase cytochrome c subunit